MRSVGQGGRAGGGGFADTANAGNVSSTAPYIAGKRIPAIETPKVLAGHASAGRFPPDAPRDRP